MLLLRRYDAFETTMEILRMQRQYPGVPPEQYADKDEAFRKFMACDAREHTDVV